MPYASTARAAAPWAGGLAGSWTPPNQVLPPPVPGGTSSYYWATEAGAYPWALGGWAGGRQLTYLPGGIVVIPDPDAGVMRLKAWWPGAAALLIVRIEQDGTRHPVRGGYGLLVGPTRINLCPNPSFEAGLNGTLPADGNPTLAQVADPAATAGSYVLRATVASAGSVGVTLPTTLLGAPPTTLTATIGFDARLSTRPTALRVVVSWADAGGGALAPTTVTFSADDINRSVAQFGRQVAQLTAPVGAVTPTMKVVADGMPAGGQLSLDAVTIEQGTTSGSRFDGGSLGGTWTGTPGLSTSTLAEVVTIADGECPLDVPVTYLVADPSITGGRATSPQAVLDSGDRSWLTHPASSDAPVRVSLRAKPVLEHPIAQGRFRPINRKKAIVVTAAQRQSPEGTVDINALSAADRMQLLELLDDGQPVLVRAPAAYNWAPRWLSLGTLTEDPEDRLAYQDAWKLSADFVEVDAPSALVA